MSERIVSILSFGKYIFFSAWYLGQSIRICFMEIGMLHNLHKEGSCLFRMQLCVKDKWPVRSLHRIISFHLRVGDEVFQGMVVFLINWSLFVEGTRFQWCWKDSNRRVLLQVSRSESGIGILGMGEVVKEILVASSARIFLWIFQWDGIQYRIKFVLSVEI